MIYRVNEIFDSVQGEGNSSGRSSTFIRLYGCNLACPWCDSKYANKNKEYTEMSVEDMIGKIRAGSNVVITGGEPLLNDLTQLIEGLQKHGCKIEIETNGTKFKEELADIAIAFNVSPKLYHIDEAVLLEYVDLQNARNAHSTVAFKFVIGDRKDYNQVKELVTRLNMKNVILMPLGTTMEEMIDRTKMMCDWLKDENWIVPRVVPRMHIILFGNKRGV